MWLVALVGCGGGPRGAVDEVARSLADGDRAAFERVVDTDVVVGEFAEACVRLAAVDGLADRQFQPRNLLEDVLLPAATPEVAPELAAEWAGVFVRDFPQLPVATCPALAFDFPAASVTKLDADHARADLPFEVPDHRGAWTLELERREDGWHVAHVRGDVLVDQWRARELALARERAQGLVLGLADGAPHEDWLAVRHYVGRHPEDLPVRSALREALDRVEGNPGLLPAAETGFFKPRGWFRNRHVGTRVTNRTDRTVASATVRFALLDQTGMPVMGAGGLEALVVELTDLPPAAEREVVSPASGGTWGQAARVEATVIAVRFGDGETWRHAAVEAGAWSPYVSPPG